MARFTIYSPAGVALYEGTPSFTGQYMKPGLLEFREVALPALVDLVPGCYVDYTRTGHRYRIYTAPQLKKQARTNTYGGAFVYQSVQLYDASKMLEYCPFRDLVLGDNRIHFSTQPSISTFEGCDGLARRFEACLRDQYDVNGVQSWAVRIATASENPDLYDLMLEPRDFTVSGVNILECLDKIYEIWPGVGWLYTVENSVDTIVIGGVGTNSGTYAYGKGNGLTSLTRTAANAEEIANRIFAYGSSRNMLPRWYNSQNIKDAESVDIQNLMIPVSSWGLTDNLPDAAKAFVEDAASILKNGLRPATVYFDGAGEYPEIYPSLRETTIGMVRTAIGDSTAKYYPSTAVYTDSSQRIDQILSAPASFDSGLAGDAPGKANVEMGDTPFSANGSFVMPAGITYYPFYHYQGTWTPETAGLQTIAWRLELSGQVQLDGIEKVAVSVKVKDPSYQGPVILSSGYELTPDGNGIILLSGKEMVAEKASVSAVPYIVNVDIAVYMTEQATDKTGTYTASGNVGFALQNYRKKFFNISIRQVGFDINEQSALGNGKTIAMRTGKCAGRSFAINSVQYDSTNDAWVLECWRTEDESLSQWFPNTDYPVRGLENAGQSNEYPGDEFVLLDIAMPATYVQMAEQKLLTAAQELLADMAVERWQYSPEIDAKFMVENSRTINAGEYLLLSDADIIGQTAESVLVDTVAINEGESAIPTYKVTLRDRKKKTWTESQSPEQSSGKPVGSIQTQQDTPYVDLSGYVNTDEFNDLADRVTALEGESFFMLDSSGNVTLKASYNNLWVPGWLAAGGVGSGGGGGGGVDLDRVWQSLTNNTDKPNVKINIAHIPDITTAKITDLESWISAKGYALNSSLPTEQTVAGWGFTKNAGTVTSVILNSGDGIAVTNSGVPIISSGSRTISISSTYRTRINNGNTAYGWGNHADAGYLTSADLSGYATESWANNRFLLKAGGDISGDIFHEIEETEEGSGEIVIDELWRITENGDATFKSLSVDGVDFSTINSRVNTLWNARNNYVTISGAQTITGAKTFSGEIVMSDSDIVPSADSANRIGSSSARFGAGYIRNIFAAYLGFTSDDGQTQRGAIGMGDGNATIHLFAPGGTEYGQYSFFGAYGFFHSGNGDVPCGRGDHRWEKVWSVDGDLSGNLSVGGNIGLASSSHIDIGPARIEYDDTNKAVHVTTNQSGNDAPTIGFWVDGFSAAGGVVEGGGSGVGTGWINANDFGFLPTKTASANATALNECLRGGGKTVIVSKPGTYQLDATILLYDDTTLVFGDGVVVKKAGGQQNVFRNEGATTRTYNRNIRIVNLVLSVSGSGMTNDVDSEIFGLRGEVAFLCTENVSVSGFRCEDLANGAYAIQFNQSYNFLVENFVIRGQKDGIHISSVDTFVIRRGVIRTDDDALALNACDWVSSNCVDGDITNGIIEDVTDEVTNYSPGGYGCRLLVGAWADWSSGMSVRRGDTVVSDGKIYRAYTDTPTSTIFTSAVRPTIATFSGKQQDTGGFYWKLMRSDKVYYSSNIVNVEFRNIRFLSQRRGFVEEVDTDDQYNRSLYPSVAYADYPKVYILIDGYVYDDASRSPFVFSENTHTHLRIDGMSGGGATFYVPSPADASMLMRLDASHIDFRKVTAQTFITNGYHTEIRLMDCVADAPIPVASYGRIITNNNLADLPGDPARGDQVIHNGTPKVYNGTSWTSLI